MSKTGFGKVDWKHHVVNTNRSKTGDVLQTSQGPVVFTKDTALVKNDEQAAELKERYPRFIRTVAREAPISSTRVSFLAPDLPWKKANRRSRLDREEEERERAASQAFDQ